MTFRSTIFYSANPTSTIVNAAYYEPAAVHFANDSTYYKSAAGSGMAKLGTACAVFRLAGLPDTTQRLFFSRGPASVAGGWYFCTFTDGGLACVYRDGASVVVSPTYLFAAGDVGKCFIAHGTYESGAVRLYIMGLEQNSGTAGNAPADASGTDELRVGNFQNAAGLNNPYIDPIVLLTSTDSYTPANILAHAQAIVASRAATVPILTNEVERYFAEDLFPTPPATWLDRDTTVPVNLTKVGSPTVYRV